MDVPGGTQRNLWPSGRRAFSLWEPMSMARGWEALNLGLLGQDARILPRRPRPLLQCSPGLPMRAGQAGPPPSRDRVPARVWPCSLVQSWHAWICVGFCSRERPEQEPAFVDSSVVFGGLPRWR